MPELKGTSLLYRQWTVTPTQAAVILVHGLGAHTQRWDFLGKYLSAKGFAAYALELKGFGETPDRPRGHISSFNIYYQDILSLLEIVQKENPGKKVFLLGESLGGLISFVVSGDNPGKFAGLITISPAFANGMKFSLANYFTAFTSLLYNPKKLIKMPFTSAMCTRDKDYRKIMDLSLIHI